MDCVVCKNGQLTDGYVTVTLQRGEKIIVIKQVPAQICQNCGDYMLTEKVTQRLMHMANQAVREHDTQVEVLSYAA